MKAIIALKKDETGQILTSVVITLLPETSDGDTGEYTSCQDELDLHRLLALCKAGGMLVVSPSTTSKTGQIDIYGVTMENY